MYKLNFKFFLATLFCTDKLHSLESCSSTCNNLWDGFGRWKNDKWRPYLEGKNSSVIGEAKLEEQANIFTLLALVCNQF